MFERMMAKHFLTQIVDGRKTMAFPGESTSATPEGIEAYDMTQYIFMSLDQARVGIYRRGIHRAVAGKVVLEIGTGALALLARICVEAGARKVYAVEANDAAATAARQLVEREGLSDRIQVIHAFSYDVVLPEPAAVLLHEVIGPMGSDEGMVRIVMDARDRMLAPNAAFVPSQTAVQCVPVSRPVIRNPVTARIAELMSWKIRVEPRKTYIYNFPKDRFLGEAQEFERKTFGGDLVSEERRELRFPVTHAGAFDGFLLWNRITVSDGDTLECLEGTGWPLTYLGALDQPVTVRPGDTIVLKTYQNLREYPRYEFATALRRGSETIDLGAFHIGAGSH